MNSDGSDRQLDAPADDPPGPSIPGVVSRTMLEPGVSEIGAVVGSYSAAHRVDNSVELPHVRCIAERAK